MAGESLYETVTNAIVDGVRDALDHVDPRLPALIPPDEAGARAALNDLMSRAQAITNAGDPATWVSAVEQWKAKLDDLAAKAFGGPSPLDALIVRVLEQRMPRTAAFLALVGIIVHAPGGQDTIDRAKAQQFLTDPGTLVNESLWDALLGDASIPGTGRLPAVIIGALLLAPQTVIGLTRGNLKVAGLPSPPTDAPGPWRTFREASDAWLSMTVPIGDPVSASPVPRGIYHWHADLLPDLSATLALRSRRVPLGGGKNRTEVELWLAIALEQNEWQYSFKDDDGKDSGWFLKAEPGISAGFGYDGSWHGAFRQMLTNTSLVPGPKDPVSLTFGRDAPPGVPDLILGPPYDTRLVAKDVSLFLRVREDHPIVEVGAFVHGFSAVLTNRWWRTFGVTNELFGDGIRLDLALDIAYVEGKGLQLNLGAGLDVTFHINKEWGKDSFVGLKLHSIRLYVPIQATANTFDIRGELTFHVSLKVGPVVLVVEGLGGWGGYWTESGTKHYVGFLPPTGAGLQISYGPVTGGGFLEWGRPPNLNEHFAGVLYLKIYAFEVTAFGIHELTGSPADVVRKTSFVMVLGIRFSPGIQLGYGFAITGFGGLIGINRRADTDALRERLTSGAAGNVLFAEDPIRNAPELLSDLGALFPAADGVYVFGPTIQISWLKIGSFKVFKIDVGLFFELTGASLTKIVLLGSVRATIPDLGDDVPKLLQLRFDVVGFVDFPKSIVEVDATLINSKALYTFHLTGDLAFRVSWGSQPFLLLSFGGFHPRFDPKPAQFPDLTRLALTLDSGMAGLFFRAEAYLAITSNTIQFGARLEVGYKLGPFNLTGFLGLDAIIQFSPFWFEIAISAGVRLRWNETTLCGVRLEGTLSGPGPFTISGKACIELLFFDICGSATITLGPSSNSAAPPSTASTAQALQSEIADPDNLSSQGGDDRHAVQKPRPSAAGAPPVVSPLGQLCWMQKRAPLGTTLDRFEGQPLAAPQRVVAVCPLSTGAATDWFAPGSFTNLSESEALNRPGFERLDAGMMLAFGTQQSSKVPHDVSVIEVRLPKFVFLLGADAFAFAAVTLAGAVARTGGAAVRTTTAKFGVTDERFVVRTKAGVKILGGTVTEAHQQARSLGAVALQADDVMQLGGRVMATEVHLDFLGWRRSGLYANVASATLTPEGRLRASAPVTLQNQLPPNETATGTLTFDIVGPGDVEALKAGAVLHMVPPPGSVDFEETKCAYVELAEADLPWRYTPQLVAGLALRPWVALVVGTPQEVQLQSGGTVTLANTVLAAHDLAMSARWAHVQDDRDHPGERMVARLLSPRDLDPLTEYVAVVVPAFTAVATPAWTTATPQVVLPAFASWRFRTSTEGDFPSLASRLQPALAGSDLGRAPLEYTPLAARPVVSVRGALAPIGGTDAPTPPDVITDVGVLTTPVVDPRRPTVGLPDYGDAWIADPAATTWGAAFHEDARPRGVAGLGLRAGIDEQDLLSEAASKQAGALDEASRRIRNLTAGLGAARSLWVRRLPSDPIRRLAIFGPSLTRMMTDQGTVLQRITGPGRPLPPALFSSSARRALRSGPARTALAAKGANDPGNVLVSANRCPDPAPKAPTGLPHADDLGATYDLGSLDDWIEKAIEAKSISFEQFEKLVDAFDRSGYAPSTLNAFDQVMKFWLERARQHEPIPVLGLLAILDPTTEKRPDDKELLALLRALHGDGPIEDPDALLGLITGIATKPPRRPCAPVDLVKVAMTVGDAIDPTVARPFVVDRVLGTITGLDDQPLSPPELCPDLDIPAWQFLRDHNPNWLLPGAGTLPEDGVVAVETNPTFVDAFLVGVNTQITSELRFRNIPMRTGCTPLRQFWARTNPATESYDDDIVGVHKWPAASALGSTTHQTPAAASADLVVVFRTPLFRRYPQTIVYLTPAALVGGEPDWDGDPDFANRLAPSFQGAITPEIVFFGFDLDPPKGRRYWVVLEEPPHGFQFFCRADTANWPVTRVNQFNNATNGAEFASAAFADPYRVMIRGSSLIPVGGP